MGAMLEPALILLVGILVAVILIAMIYAHVLPRPGSWGDTLINQPKQIYYEKNFITDRRMPVGYRDFLPGAGANG